MALGFGVLGYFAIVKVMRLINCLLPAISLAVVINHPWGPSVRVNIGGSPNSWSVSFDSSQTSFSWNTSIHYSPLNSLLSTTRELNLQLGLPSRPNLALSILWFCLFWTFWGAHNSQIQINNSGPNQGDSNVMQHLPYHAYGFSAPYPNRHRPALPGPHRPWLGRLLSRLVDFIFSPFSTCVYAGLGASLLMDPQLSSDRLYGWAWVIIALITVHGPPRI